VLVEGQFWTEGSPFNLIFDAVVEAAEEAAFNAMVAANTVEGREGNTLYGFPVDRGIAHPTQR
jgi:D-aminopeptidase